VGPDGAALPAFPDDRSDVDAADSSAALEPMDASAADASLAGDACDTACCVASASVEVNAAETASDACADISGSA
jgi:hypothetical protein